MMGEDGGIHGGRERIFDGGGGSYMYMQDGGTFLMGGWVGHK